MWCTYADEDDGRSNGHQTVKLHESIVLVAVLGDIEVHLLDALDGEFCSLKSDFVGVWGEETGKLEDLWREGGGEENGLDIAREEAFVGVSNRRNCRERIDHGLPLDTVALAAQALLVEHVVCLVENQDLDGLGLELLPPDNVEDGSRSSDDNMGIHVFTAMGRVGNSLEELETFHELAHHLSDTHNLSGKLARRSKDESLRLAESEVDAGEDVQDEGGRLACAGLGLADEVSGGGL